MLKFARKMGKLALGLGLALMLQVQPTPWLATADSTGRDYGRCNKACNDSRKACEQRCTSTCSELFPGGGASFDACKAECVAGCRAERDDCKLVCDNIKNPPSPEEP
jgi:hypothetical protein